MNAAVDLPRRSECVSRKGAGVSALPSSSAIDNRPPPSRGVSLLFVPSRSNPSERTGGGVRARLKGHDRLLPPSLPHGESCMTGTQLPHSSRHALVPRQPTQRRSPACPHTPRTSDSATRLDRGWQGGRAGACDPCAPELWHTAPLRIPGIARRPQRASGADDKRERSGSHPPYRFCVRPRGPRPLPDSQATCGSRSVSSRRAGGRNKIVVVTVLT